MVSQSYYLGSIAALVIVLHILIFSYLTCKTLTHCLMFQSLGKVFNVLCMK